ncbi:hypothetical protein KCU85_g10054, partial [Aureobasidium melanogenum]
EIEEEDVESDPEEDDDEEESSDEESSDDEPDNHLCDRDEGIHALHAYVPSCFTKMFDIMMKHGEEAFPSINGQRFLHPHNFDNMLDQIRNAFWDHRLVVVDYDFKAFIVEKPPLGSTFAPAGYIIPTGERVNKMENHDTGSAGTDLGGQTGHEARVYEGSHAPSDIPEQYKKWKRLFQEEENANALPRHQPWDHEIRLEPGKQPTFGPIYALSEKELKTLREYLDENLARGFIRKSESPAGYPILFAPKKDGSLRLCVDYRKLNDITIKNRYPLPNIEELQDRLAKAKWFSKIDLKGAYNLIRMKEGEEWKTAFRTRYGHYEYLVMPFGLTNAPATCQMMINDTLREYLDITVVAYLDDILIYTDGDLNQHIKDVQQVLAKLEERRLKANPKKCEFHVKETEFLGFIIGIDGIRIDPAKITSIKEWPTPKNLKEVQSFLGLANYNRKFISGYSQTALPL